MKSFPWDISCVSKEASLLNHLKQRSVLQLEREFNSPLPISKEYHLETPFISLFSRKGIRTKQSDTQKIKSMRSRSKCKLERKPCIKHLPAWWCGCCLGRMLVCMHGFLILDPQVVSTFAPTGTLIWRVEVSIGAASVVWGFCVAKKHRLQCWDVHTIHSRHFVLRLPCVCSHCTLWNDVLSFCTEWSCSSDEN